VSLDEKENEPSQKDVKVRWTVKQGQAPVPRLGGKPPPAIFIPVVGDARYAQSLRGLPALIGEAGSCAREKTTDVAPT
jgi:hypothetical protein